MHSALCFSSLLLITANTEESQGAGVRMKIKGVVYVKYTVLINWSKPRCKGGLQPVCLQFKGSNLAKIPPYTTPPKKERNKTPHSWWCFFFLHHLAFLRHIEVLTFQADRFAEEKPAVTQKHRNSSQVELLPYYETTSILCIYN